MQTEEWSHRPMDLAVDSDMRRGPCTNWWSMQGSTQGSLLNVSYMTSWIDLMAVIEVSLKYRRGDLH